MEWELEPPQPIVIDMSGGGDSTTQPMEVEVNASTPHQSRGLTALVKAAAGSQGSLPLASSSTGVAASSPPARIPATLSQVSDTVVQSVRSSLGRTVKSLKDLRDVVTGVHTGNNRELDLRLFYDDAGVPTRP